MTLKTMLTKASVTATFLGISAALFAAEPDTGIIKTQVAPSVSTPNLMETAVFVRNNGGKELNNEIDTFNDMLCARLAENGFSVMTWGDIIQKFSESNESEENILKDAKSFMDSVTITPSNESFNAFKEASSQKRPQDSMTAKTKDGGMTDSSALRIAQMLGAKYMIVASMGKLGHEKRILNGEGTIYKTGNELEIYSMPLSVRIMDGNTGQSIYGSIYMASKKIYQNKNLQITLDNVVDKLLYSGTESIVGNIVKKLNQIKKAKLASDTGAVQFYLDCNISGATAQLDGAAIGSPPGIFKARPGLHQLRITRQYFEPWEQTVNIFDNQKLAVSLEFTVEGQAKFKDLAAFKQSLELEKATTLAEIDIAKQQSQADADAKEKVSSGEEAFLKNSYIRSDGFAEQLTEIIHGYK